MTPFDDLKPLDMTELDGIDVADLAQPWDDNPDLQGPEIDATKQLEGDRAILTSPTARMLVDWRSNPDAYRHLAVLPAEGQSLHGIISGKYALWDLVPALLAHHRPAVIDDLCLATLSFSQANAAEILALVDAGRIKRISLLVSHYFKGTSPHIYDSLVPKLVERGQPVCAMRTHAKVITAAFSTGPKYVCESSANLRSCKNVEQFVLTRDPALYEFHRQWIGELIAGRGVHGWSAKGEEK